MIVAEFMSHGSLDQFLRSRDARGDGMGIVTMLSMMTGIASGMKYLTEKGFVHRVSRRERGGDEIEREEM